MSKRFTETGKWADPWFRSLSTRQKALWQWLLDNCDCAGVLGEIDWGLVSFQIGETCSEDDMKTFGGRIEPCGKGWWVAKFVAFQVGYVEAETLSKPHRGVLKALAKASIPLHKAMETLSKPLPKGLETLKDKDKDKDKEKEMQLRAGTLLRKRADTLWDHAEIRAYAKNKSVIAATDEADWLVLEKFYAAPQAETFARKSLATLLNNWNGEIDRAKNWQIEAGKKSKPTFTRESTIDRS